MINLYESPLLLVYTLVMSGILGAVMGSGITCQADRLSVGESWLKGRSHCDECGHELSILDLFPIVSYLVSGGKCRYCGAKLSKKYLITETLMALAFMGIVLHYGTLCWNVLRDMGLTCVLLGLSVVDLNKYEIPDGYIVFGIVWFLLFAFLNGKFVGELKSGLLGGLSISVSVLLLSLVMDKVLKKESMGGGDIKLFFMCDLYLGLGASLFSLILACLIGLMFVLVLKNEKIPFGPSISIATYISLIAGSAIVSWYLGLF